MADDAPVGIKVQAKLDAYEAWAFSRLMERKGWRNHDLCRHIVRDWLQLKRDELRDEYEVSREAWEREKGGNVRPISKSRKERRDGGRITR